VKKYYILLLLIFILLIYSFGCGSPTQDIGSSQSFQNSEAMPSPETPAALSGDSVSSDQELTSQQGASSLPEDGAQEDIFAVYGDGKLIAAWGTDAEGNSYPISREKVEKFLPSDFTEKLKYCKEFNSPRLYRSASGEFLDMDLYNGTAYTTDFHVGYLFTYNPPNPCATPFVFKIGWVSPDLSENTITKFAPEIPPCAAGGMCQYTSGISGEFSTRWFRIVNEWSEGGFISPASIEATTWHNNLSFFSFRNIPKLKLGKWQIPTSAGGTSISPAFMRRQLAVEHFSAKPAPTGGYIITGDVAVLPDHPQPPAVLNWTVKIMKNENQEIVYTQKGTGDKIEAAWDGKVSGQAVDPNLYCYSIHIDAPQEKTWSADVKGRFQGTSTIEVWTTENTPKLIATSDPEADQTKLLNQVFLPARQGNQVTIVVKDPPTSAATYDVQINTSKTNPQNPLPFTLTKDSETHLYKGALPLSSPWIVNNPRGNLTTFTSLDAVDPFLDLTTFVDRMYSPDRLPPYPSPSNRLEMGRAILGANPINTDDLEPSISFVQAAGFEEVKVWFPKPYTNINARFRVKNEANVLYINCHGGRNYNTLYLYNFDENDARNLCAGPDPHYSFRSPDIEPTDWSNNLRTVILYTCWVLDINDYNDNCYQPSDRLRFSPGENWDALGSKNKVLLGFNCLAPPHPVHVPIINEYFDLLKSSSISEEPLAWLLANSGKANAGWPDRLADNACAIANNAYYFIKYEKYDQYGRHLPLVVPGVPTVPCPDAPHHRNRILYMIPRTGTYWGTPWQYLPPGAAVPLSNQNLKDF